MNYQTRSIRFYKLMEIGDWRAKVYHITYKDQFEALTTLNNAIEALPDWLAKADTKTETTGKMASLIVHEGKDGIWSVLSWWVGGNMLQTQTYHTPLAQPQLLNLYTPDGSIACVWELAVINHERIAWTNHVLKKHQPDYDGLLADVLNIDI